MTPDPKRVEQAPGIKLLGCRKMRMLGEFTRHQACGVKYVACHVCDWVAEALC